MVLSITSLLLLRACLKGASLEDIDVLGDVSLKDLAGNWLATLGEKLGIESGDTLKKLADAVQGAGGLLPQNHDLRRAQRHALALALRAFQSALRARDEGMSADERQWVNVLGYVAEDLAKDSAKAEEVFARCEGKLGGIIIEHIQVARGSLDAVVTDGLHRGLFAWLNEEQLRFLPKPNVVPTGWTQPVQSAAALSVPKLAEEWLLDPQGFCFMDRDSRPWLKRLLRHPPVARPLLRMTVLQAWSQCFIEQLKSGDKNGDRAFKAHLIQCLDDLKQAVPAHGEVLERARLQLDQALTATLRIERQLAHLLGITTEKLAAITAQGGETHTLLSDLIARSEEHSKAWQAVRDELGDIADLLNEQHAPPIDQEVLPPITDAQTTGTLDKLRYRKRWLPILLCRDALMSQLFDFLDRDEPYLIHVMVGEAGMGKSRMALELVRIAQERGWRAGFLLSGANLSSDALLHQWRPTGSTLLVMDYASSHNVDLAPALAKMSLNAHEFEGKLRVLLLDRPEALATPINDISVGSSDANIHRAKVRRHLHQRTDEADDRPRDRPYEERLDALTVGALNDAECEAFLTAVFERAGQPDRALPEDWRSNIETAAKRRPLMLTVLALHYLRAEADGAARGDMDQLLDEVIVAEVEGRWLRVIADKTRAGGPDASTLLPAVQRFIAIAIFCRGLSLTEHVKRVREALGFQTADDRIVLDVVKHLLGTVEQSDGKRLRPLEPDLLAERFLLRGGYTPPPLCEWDDSAQPPFHWQELLPLAMELDPRGVVDTLALLRRDYPETVKEVALALLPHLRDDTGVFDADGNCLPFESVSHPVMQLWVLLLRDLAAEVFSEEPPERPVLSALVAWSRATAAAAFSSVVAPVIIAEQLRTSPYLLEKWDGAVLQPLMQPLDGRGHAMVLSHRGRLMAMFAVNAIAHYGSAKDWPALERWGDVLQQQAREHEGNQEVQLELAKGAFNAINHYGSAKDWPALERWGNLLQQQAREHEGNQEIQLELAKGAVNAINHYGSAKDWPALERWGDVLQQQAREHEGNQEIQLALANGAFNAINHYGSAKDWPALERWGDVLQQQAREHEGNQEIQLALAKGSVNAINHYGSAKDWPALERWGDVLQQQAREHEGNQEIQFELAKGSVNAISDYGSAKDWPALERWGDVLQQQAREHEGNQEIQLELANGAFNAISDYGSAKDWPALERWGDVLQQQAREHEGNQEIQLELAEGAFNAINHYGSAKDWDQQRAWATRLMAVLPERLTSEEQVEEIQRVFDVLRRIQQRDQQPHLQAVIDSMEQRFVSSQQKQEITPAKLIALLESLSEEQRQQVKEALAGKGIDLDALRDEAD